MGLQGANKSVLTGMGGKWKTFLSCTVVPVKNIIRAKIGRGVDC